MKIPRTKFIGKPKNVIQSFVRILGPIQYFISEP